MKFKVKDEMIHRVEGVRLQIISWKNKNWNIFTNDRFEPNDFEKKVRCESCDPTVYSPKVIDYRGHRLCKSCLTRMIEMLDAAELEDCKRTREERQQLKENLEQTRKDKKHKPYF